MLAIKSHAIYIMCMSDDVPAIPTLDQMVCFTVYSTALALNRTYKPLLDKLGLTYLQYMVLLALAEQNDQTVGELGQHLFLESNTLTPMLKRMEAAGIINRRRDTQDERVVRISLTEQGRALLQETTCVPEQALQASGMKVEQLYDMQKMMLSLRANLLDKSE